MILGRVTGTVVATKKHPRLEGNRLLIVQPVDLEKRPTGSSFLALDVVDAGEGDLVIVNREGGGARIVLGDQKVPIQAIIVGIVDGVDASKLALPVERRP
ncbi:MAG: EutN/CcmL family microcompartment protein [Planctomycetota bacterium]